jgi:hypothetical protein
MSEVELPIQPTKTLIKALVVAVSLAAIIFVTIVLPSEYNIDPTGVGNALGLTVLAATAVEPEAGTPDLTGEVGYREDQTTITVPANSGLEYKFLLQQYENLIYTWSSEENDLYFDLHGEPQGDTAGYFESFAAATGSEMKGSITVPFTGSHGWYWRNENSEDVVVSLKTQGTYEIIGLK